MIKFVDLFAGIGGIRLGFEEACEKLNIKTKCILSSEIDPKACETYALNFGEHPEGDIHQIKEIDDFDFLLAGFPCQPFSFAGKQKGFGDTRGTLFFEVERILKDKQPKAFLLENVRGLITHDNGRTLKTILSKLEKAGYGVDCLILNSSNFNVPQNRVRIYILGLLNSKPKLTLKSDVGSADSHKYKEKSNQSDFFVSDKLLVKDILEQDTDPKYKCTDSFIEKITKIFGNEIEKLNGVRAIDYRHGNSIHSWQLGIKGQCSAEEIEFMNLLVSNRRKKIFGTHQDGKKLTLEQIRTFYNKPDIEQVINSLSEKGYLKEDGGKYNPVCGNMSFEVFKFLDPDSISITIVSSDAHRLGVVQNGVPRRITPRECARLQGFPDWFKFHPADNFAYKQFGNSVTVEVVKAVVSDFLSNNKSQITGKSVNVEEARIP